MVGRAGFPSFHSGQAHSSDDFFINCQLSKYEQRFFEMVGRTGRYSNRLPTIVIPYNPLILQTKCRLHAPIKKPKISVFRNAQRFHRMLKEGVVSSKSELARREGLSPARVTQVLNLLKLAPEIKQYLTSLPDDELTKFFSERRLNEIARIKDNDMQLRKFRELRRQGDVQKKP